MKTLLTLIIALLCSVAHAGNCNHFFQKQVYHQQHAVVQQVVAVPYAYYAAGQDIQMEAIAEKIIQRLEKRDALKQQQKQSVSSPAPTVSPNVFAKCASCHSGANAAGGLVLDGQSSISCHAYFRWGQMAGQGKNIPPKMEAALKSMSPEEKGAINDALLDRVEQAPTPAPPVVSGELE